MKEEVVENSPCSLCRSVDEVEEESDAHIWMVQDVDGGDKSRDVQDDGGNVIADDGEND